ncbi:ABC transporter ATP-binding protein [Myxococcota bacterium]|nr:ABC transporter ATP-binding protein [Myxococcota bacterium]
MTLALETRDLTRSYRGRAVVAGLDLAVEEGAVYGFLGPNGAGKTTTIRMIAGLIRPDRGSVRIFGESHRVRRLAHVGGIVESPALYPYLTGHETLRVLAAATPGVDRRRIDEVLDVVRLRDRARDRVSTYSLGMKQRLGIAQALMGRPRLLLLDEPTNGLDPAGIREMRELVGELNREHRLTVFVSSHILAEVSQMCDRVGIVQSGRLVAQGEVEALLRGGDLVEVRIQVDDLAAGRRVLQGLPWAEDRGESPAGEWVVHLRGGDAATLNRALVQAGIGVSSLVPQRMSLEDFFIQVTGGARQIG